MRLSTLHLNNANIEACISESLSALKHFEEYDTLSESKGILTEGYKIKTFEVLSRAY